MNILLIGYGKMGKAIEEIAIERGHNISGKIDLSNATQLKSYLNKSDVAIEFTQPESAVNNIINCFENNVPVVVGTTGWYKEFEKVKDACKQLNGSILPATNFSIGVNIFFALNEYLAEIMNQFPEYEVEMEEIHHTQKLDKPSGTAITTAEKILSKMNRLKQWSLDNKNNTFDLAIKAIREENVPGTHSVKYESEIDIIELKHEAKNRKGFALGAVLAAEFIQHKKGIFTMQDLLPL